MAVSVDDHLSEILGSLKQLPPYAQPLLDAIGLPVAVDVLAKRDLPTFDNSAMDGYAVVASDLANASAEQTVALMVVGDAHAGRPYVRTVTPGSAVRIMTGAPIPHGADAVIPFEQTDSGVAVVQAAASVTTGQHVRRAGEDISTGQVLVRSGEIIGPRQVGLLAGAGIDQVKVAPRPRVVVIATGDELVAPGEALKSGAIHDSNSYLITAAVRAAGAIAYRVAVPSDEPADFAQVLDDQLVRADLVVTTGGVSKGTRDVVKAALKSEPGMTFREVDMQPGKPQGFGFVGIERTPLFALPGNPVSAYVSFVLFVEPALRALTGRTPTSRPMFRAALGTGVRSVMGRRQFLRGVYSTTPDGPVVTPVDGQGSHMLGGLARSNALIVVHEHQVDLRAGAPVPVILLDRDY